MHTSEVQCLFLFLRHSSFFAWVHHPAHRQRILVWVLCMCVCKSWGSENNVTPKGSHLSSFLPSSLIPPLESAPAGISFFSSEEMSDLFHHRSHKDWTVASLPTSVKLHALASFLTIKSSRSAQGNPNILKSLQNTVSVFKRVIYCRALFNSEQIIQSKLWGDLGNNNKQTEPKTQSQAQKGLNDNTVQKRGRRNWVFASKYYFDHFFNSVLRLQYFVVNIIQQCTNLIPIDRQVFFIHYIELMELTSHVQLSSYHVMWQSLVSRGGSYYFCDNRTTELANNNRIY